MPPDDAHADDADGGALTWKDIHPVTVAGITLFGQQLAFLNGRCLWDDTRAAPCDEVHTDKAQQAPEQEEKIKACKNTE